MIIDTRELAESQEIDTDICILGGGVSGLVCAMELLKTNKKITVLESGGAVFDQTVQELYKAESKPSIFPNTMHSRLRMLGGSSNHWENSTERLDSIDFEKREWVSDSGWPISYDEVAKHYPEAEQYCGVGSEGYNFNYWKEKLNISDLVADSKALHTSILKAALPPTRFYEVYKSRLLNKNNLDIYTYANLVDIEWESQSGKVVRAFFKSPKGTQYSIKAQVFVMSLGGIENTRMLLSFNEKYGNKLGNKNDLVGRYFMEHPVIRGAHLYPLKELNLGAYQGLFHQDQLIRARLKIKENVLRQKQLNNLRLFLLSQDKRILSHGISSMHIVASDLSKGEIPDHFGQHLVNILKDIDVIADSISRKVFDYQLSSDADKFGGYQVLSMIEQTPTYDSRITLGESKDSLGLKKIKIKWKLSDQDKQRTWQAMSLLSKDPSILKVGRFRLLTEREDRIWGDQLGFSQHHIGTTKMSNNPNKGVVNPECLLNGTSNFYIGGSSVFPTGGHVPPTLTIVAMTIKLANDIQRRHLS